MGLAGAEAASAAACERAAGASQLLQAAAWAQSGSSQLALAHSLTHLACYADACSAEDRSLAYAQVACQVGQRHGYAAAEQVWGASRL